VCPGDLIKVREKYRNDSLWIYNPSDGTHFFSREYTPNDIVSLVFLGITEPLNICLASLKNGNMFTVVINKNECELC
jgi:hypothetical protein